MRDGYRPTFMMPAGCIGNVSAAMRAGVRKFDPGVGGLGDEFNLRNRKASGIDYLCRVLPVAAR